MGKAGDLIQEVSGTLEKPEVRVWCHPMKLGRGCTSHNPRRDETANDDYYYVFHAKGTDHKSITSALNRAKRFIKRHIEAESTPLIAYDGYEFTEESFWQYYLVKNTSIKNN